MTNQNVIANGVKQSRKFSLEIATGFALAMTLRVDCHALRARNDKPEIKLVYFNQKIFRKEVKSDKEVKFKVLNL